jgi:hypothetical protein
MPSMCKEELPRYDRLIVSALIRTTRKRMTLSTIYDKDQREISRMLERNLWRTLQSTRRSQGPDVHPLLWDPF